LFFPAAQNRVFFWGKNALAERKNHSESFRRPRRFGARFALPAASDAESRRGIAPA
jgi:hypothetical protein